MDLSCVWSTYIATSQMKASIRTYINCWQNIYNYGDTLYCVTANANIDASTYICTKVFTYVRSLEKF